MLVELGTHRGVSYSAFCEAVVHNKLATRCYAIDTWKGDEQTGFYNEDVYLDFRAFHDAHYAGFSELLRCTFDDALAYFSDASIDLLHIDGLHTYDAVRHDFERWQSKLSDRALVLFHDTNVRERDFGVWRWWEELRRRYPSFEFLHGHGLGLLGFGRSVPPGVAALCSLTDPERVNTVRERFSFLGERSILLNRQQDLHTAPLPEPEAELAAAKADPERLSGTDAEARAHAAQLQQLEVQLATVRAEAERQRAAEAEMRTRAALRAAQARTEAAEALAKLAQKKEVDLSWLEPPAVRRAIEVANWTLNRRLTEKLRQRSIDTMRGRLRAAAHYLVKGPVVNGPSPQLEQGLARSGTLPRTAPGPSRRASSLLYISGEPDSAGHVYRVLRYVDAAVGIGADAFWIRLDEVAQRAKEIGEADVLFIWRAPWDKEVAFAVELARRSGTKVVFDIDDLLIDPDLARTDVIAGIPDSGVTEEQFQRQCARWQATMKAADYCTVPTEELAQHIRRLGRPALVLPNGFDRKTYQFSRQLVRLRRSEKSDGLIRIGYAGGTPTHRRDFAVAADAVARVLRDRPQCRLVLFRFPDAGKTRILSIKESGGFKGLEDRIEWRDIVPLLKLPEELARFDINIAPLEVGNVFCEAKSELKFFEAALVDVPTVASSTGPFRRAVCDGATGFLANNSDEWYSKLLQLVDDSALRDRLCRAAQHDVLRRFGHLRRTEVLASALPRLLGDGRAAARALSLELHRGDGSTRPSISVADVEIVFQADQFGEAEVNVVFALTDDSQHFEETLESVRSQTVKTLDLILLDNAIAPSAASAVVDWARRNASRFNRLIVFRNRTPVGLGATWNAGISAADTPFVLLLPSGHTILPECVAECLSTICDTGAAFAYPRMRKSGDVSDQVGTDPFDLVRLIGVGDYMDTPVLVSKEAWATVDGYTDSPAGLVGYDFWRRLIESGLGGRVAGELPLAHR
jgi:glycosyltransferase involved in cell wall biosynthesis